MLSLPAQLRHSFGMDVGGDESSSDSAYAYVPSATGWPTADCGPTPCGGGYVLSRPAPPATGSPHYLWEHIPPRLAPRTTTQDSLHLPADDWSSDELEYDLWKSEAAAQSTSATAVVSAVDASSAEESSTSGEAGRRPLHHSGGCLKAAEPARRSSQHVSTERRVGRVQIVQRRAKPCGAPCSGHIRLEIHAPCASSVSVSVSAAHVSHVSPCHVPGPCVAPASAVFSPPEKPAPARQPCCAPTARAVPTGDPPEDEMTVLARATAYLKESGWYYGMLSYQEAQQCLHRSALGTFLARDSFDHRFLFALTVQTAQGVTSVRVQFARARFRLDAPASFVSGMPTFGDVNSLVEHYAHHGHVLYDQKGRALLQMRLSRPLPSQVPSLQHRCRLALNAAGWDPGRLPDRLRLYLDQYPFSR